MSKVRYLVSGALWTAALAVPAAAASLALVAYLDENLYRILGRAAAALQLNWRSVSLEASARWPELAGMLVGQLLLLLILVLGRVKPAQGSSPAS